MSNRSETISCLNNAIEKAESDGFPISLLFIDISNLKSINHILGYELGDAFSDKIIVRLNHIFCGHYVGKLRDDEYLVILEKIENIGQIQLLIETSLKALDSSLLIKGHNIQVCSHIGVSRFPIDGIEAPTLIQYASLAMIEAKDKKIPYCIFKESIRVRVNNRQKIHESLTYALEKNEFLLYFQPKITTQSGNLAGGEALLRWKNEGVFISPEEFISIAEHDGNIIQIGTWVLEEACQQVKKWSGISSAVPIAINVSAKQLKDTNFATQVLSIIDYYGVDPEFIELEITETMMLESLSTSLTTLSKLREAGVTITLDDFGTGYSSLSYLTQLPLDILKIDRSFVSGPKHSKKIVEIILSMAKTLQLRVIAEGVETTEQKDWLCYVGCDYLQGFLISKPIPANEFERNFL